MDYCIARLRPIRTTAWHVGLLILSSEKAKMHGIGVEIIFENFCYFHL